MLLQSHDGCIELLPALPDAWQEGCFEGLMARGGFTVSAQWKDGKVVHCKVSGKEGKAFKVRINGKMIEAVGFFEM